MPDLLYLDTARIGPMSPRARQAQHDLITLAGEEPGSRRFDAFLRHGSEAWPSGMQRRYPGLASWRGTSGFRDDLLRLVPSARQRVLAASRSAALMTLAARLLFLACRNVLVSDLGWPPYHAILHRDRARRGRRVTLVPIRSAILLDGCSVEELIARIVSAYQERGCDGLFLTGVSHEGVCLPLREIVRSIEARAELRFVVVDGAQELCHGMTDLGGEWCDLYLAGCQKWLGAYHALGLGFFGRRRSAALVETVLREMLACGDLDDPLLRFLRGLELDRTGPPGETVNLAPLFSCQGAVLDAIQRGRAEVFAERRSNALRVSEASRDTGWRPLVPADRFRSGILLFRAEGFATRRMPPEAVRSAFLDGGVALTSYAGGLIRLSMPDRPLTAGETDGLRSALRRCAR